jgi:hypothetical protein
MPVQARVLAVSVLAECAIDFRQLVSSTFMKPQPAASAIAEELERRRLNVAATLRL